MNKISEIRFSKQQNRLAAIAKAMGHPARVAILEYLVKHNACGCGDIVDHLPLSQSTVSQHLKALKKVGLIKGSVEGTSVCYCLDSEAWQESRMILAQLFKKLDSCC